MLRVFALLSVMFRTRALRNLLLLVVALVLAPNAARAQARFEFVEMHMAMPVRIVLYASDTSAARQAARDAFEQIATLEGTMSDYRPQSELRRLVARAGSWATVSAPLFEVISQSVHMARATGGAFDPTVGPLVSLWREARQSGTLPDSSRIETARLHVGWHRIALDSVNRRVLLPAGMSLDLGGIAKGFILQEALGVLRRAGVTRAMIEAGGDIVLGDGPPAQPGWRLDAPGARNAFRVQANSLTHAALATSGATFQFVEVAGVRYSHVVDPRTGWAVTHSRLARVIARSAMQADALATALTVLSEHEAREVLRAFPDVIVDVTKSH